MTVIDDMYAKIIGLFDPKELTLHEYPRDAQFLKLPATLMIETLANDGKKFAYTPSIDARNHFKRQGILKYDEMTRN